MSQLLLAKSSQSAGTLKVGDSESLLGHLQDVFHAANAVLEASGHSQLTAVGLAPKQWFSRLQRLTRLAAAIHDVGKCNNQFQRMIWEPWKGHQQAIRHEWATILIVDGPWKQWLSNAVECDIEWQLLRWAVSGHHPKYGRGAPPDVVGGSPILELPLNHIDIVAISDWLQSEFALPAVPIVENWRIDLVRFDSEAEIEVLRERYWAAEDIFDDLDLEWRKLSAVLKNCLIASDVAGSAIPFEQESGFDWIADTLGQVQDTATICKKIRKKKLSSGKKNHDLRDFQKKVGASRKNVTLALAGCGTGKTLAGYHWGEHHAENRRLFFCYPTTGTGTEGFRDYLADPDLEGFVDLIHSRRVIDFELLIDSDPDRNRNLARIESLSIWMKSIVACTVDSVLGVIQNNRRGLYSWPAISQGAFVFDEVHSYDEKLFDALLHFLKMVNGVPVLILTASLQDSRRAAIEEVCGDDLAVVDDVDELELQKRYVFPAPLPTNAKALNELDKSVYERVEKEIEAGGRVLFVVNTVKRAMALCCESDATGGGLSHLNPLVYHSRFKYEDRIKRHSDVVSAFQSFDGKGCVAVTTQVCEQSLDLGAYDEKKKTPYGVTLLVSELAPVPSCIQRCGRLNRAARKNDPPKDFLVIQPRGWDGKASTLPYADDQLNLAREWLASLSGPVSQQDLIKAWKELDVAEEVSRFQSAWFDYGPANPVLELREDSPSMTVLMAEDTDGGLKRLNSNDIKKVALSMPLRRDGDDWMLVTEGRPVLCCGIPVAKAGAINYDRSIGGRWNTHG